MFSRSEDHVHSLEIVNYAIFILRLDWDLYLVNRLTSSSIHVHVYFQCALKAVRHDTTSTSSDNIYGIEI